MTTLVGALTSTDATEDARSGIGGKIQGVLQQLGQSLGCANTNATESSYSSLADVTSRTDSSASDTYRTLASSLGNLYSALTGILD